MLRTKRLIGIVGFILCAVSLRAQVVIPSTASTDASAELNVVSTTKGVLFPSLTSIQMFSIASPAIGLIIYNTNDKAFEFYNGSAWEIIGTLKSYPTSAAISALTAPAIETGQLIYNAQTNVLDFYNGTSWRTLHSNSTITP